MTEKPTYLVEDLREAIPMANLEDIKRMSIILKKEQGLYTSTLYTQLLTMITRRLIELSSNI
ncbi:MAG: hypothetical protein JWQ09_489 [Segetibacter sp.]|nr:hypothetical protein [Segetibacter sp.]